MRLVRGLASTPPQAAILGSTPGLVPVLLSLLGAALAEVREDAAHILLASCRASGEARAQVAATPGAVSLLLRLLQGARDTSLKTAAADLLALFASDPRLQGVLREPGVLGLVVESLFAPEERVAAQMARTLASALVTEGEALLAVQLGAPHSLTALLASPSAVLTQAACAAVTSLARSPPARLALVEAQAPLRLLALALRPEPGTRLAALTALAPLVSERGVAPLLVLHGALAQLAQALSAPPEEQAAAVPVLVALCAEEDHWTRFVQEGGLAALVALTAAAELAPLPPSAPLSLAQRRAVHELAELSQEAAYRQAMLGAGVLPVLGRVLLPSPHRAAPLQVDALLTLANLALEEAAPPALLRLPGVLRAVLEFLALDWGAPAAFASARIVAALARPRLAPTLRRLRDQGAISRLVQLLHHANEQGTPPALTPVPPSPPQSSSTTRCVPWRPWQPSPRTSRGLRWQRRRRRGGPRGTLLAAPARRTQWQRCCNSGRWRGSSASSPPNLGPPSMSGSVVRRWSC